MPLVFEDDVVETASAPGTGTITLLGALSGHFAFSAYVPDGAIVPICIEAVDGSNNPNGGREICYGTYNLGATTMARSTPLRSSNSGAAVNFTGAVTVSLVNPADLSTPRVDMLHALCGGV